MPGELHCPLCAGVKLSSYSEDARRPYTKCCNCSLVFVPPEWYLTREEEKAEYDLHQNDAGDTGYRAFLSRLLDPLVERLTPEARGLDFGCGPGPALAAMLAEAGYEVTLYDSFFAPDPAALDVNYDFICATEVVEHLHFPGKELAHLWSLLRPGGWMGIMTKLVRNRAAFDRWHYKNDPTHVCYFSEETWYWWAGYYGARLEFVGADVILLQRQSQPAYRHR